MFDDTIAAIATPLGEGGLAVVRISGVQALAIADKIFLPVGKNSSKPSAATSHTIHFGKIVRHNNSLAPQQRGEGQGEGQIIDEVLLAVLRAPRTFTREDTIEISCHGGILPAKLVLDTILENGARLAEPGEFTRRAFLNGRIDLAQAEAVADLIHSRTELALAAANEQLAGKLSQRINQLRDDLMQTLAHIEAHIDFPDEDISPDTKAQLLKRLENGIAFMDELLRTANEGQILRVVAFARRLLGVRMRVNPVCSINCSAMTAPSFRRFPARRATRLKKRRTFAACRSCSLTPPVCAKRAMKLKRKASAAVANRSRKRNLFCTFSTRASR